MFKKVLTTLALSSSAVFAGTMGTVCTPGNVTVPCAHSAWDIGGKALYLQTANSNNTDEITFISDNTGRYHDISNQWKWGFEIEGAYHFNTGNDVTLSWYHLDVDRGDIPYPFITPNINSVSKIKNQWDAVNVELGQFVDVSAKQKMRFHGGFQFADIKVAPAHFVGEGILSYSSEYKGFGPRLGLDLDYVFNNGFDIYAKAATALLAGNINFQVDGDINDRFYLKAFRATGNLIVPQLEAKLGGSYTYVRSEGKFTLDAGYMWFNYFNAVNYIDNYAVGARRAPGDFSNFGASGPYVGLNYVSNV